VYGRRRAMLIRPLAAAGLVLLTTPAAPAAPAAQAVRAAQAVPGARAATAARAALTSRSLARQLADDFQAAWEITRGRGVTVGVLSSGVDASVATLAGAVAKGPDYVRLGAPHNVEGTLMASMIAGSGPTAGSPFGIRGLAPAAHILSVRVYPDRQDSGWRRFLTSNTRWATALAKGIRYAAGHSARVIEIDEWGDTASKKIRSAVMYALSKGAVVVASQGPPTKEATNQVYYPAALPGVIAVGTVDLSGHRMAKYTAANTTLCVSAPGVKTPATGPGDQPYLWWGSSVATSWVAAAAALVKAQYPRLAPALVARAIAVSARHTGRHAKAGTGFGVVNPAGALAAAARLAKLTATAAPGPDAITVSQRFGPPAGNIDAVRLNPLKLAGFGATILVGVVCLAVAAVLALRLRRRGHPPDTRGQAGMSTLRR
jgi:subtilisin family serine protease